MLAGSLPDDLSSMSRQAELCLSGNKLTGSFPEPPSTLRVIKLLFSPHQLIREIKAVVSAKQETILTENELNLRTCLKAASLQNEFAPKCHEFQNKKRYEKNPKIPRTSLKYVRFTIRLLPLHTAALFWANLIL